MCHLEEAMPYGLHPRQRWLIDDIIACLPLILNVFQAEKIVRERLALVSDADKPRLLCMMASIMKGTILIV